ncbi:MAG: photosynthetic complex assembly protein PuhC [Rubrivivax sp.]|jgi:putative photosynthetic complex assembly protein
MSGSVSAPAGAARHAPMSDTLIPRWATRAVATLLALLLIGIGSARLSGWEPSVTPGALLLERSLRFTDTPDGAILVSDVTESRTLATMRGEQGFLRGVLRGLARDRRQHGIGADAPYTLSLHDDGRLLISDPSTGQRIDLASFGADNAAVFTQWLPAPTPVQPTSKGTTP